MGQWGGGEQSVGSLFKKKPTQGTGDRRVFPELTGTPTIRTRRGGVAVRWISGLGGDRRRMGLQKVGEKSKESKGRK